MERQLGQMVRLIDDLLDVSRISRGKIELRRRARGAGHDHRQAVEAVRSRPVTWTTALAIGCRRTRCT